MRPDFADVPNTELRDLLATLDLGSVMARDFDGTIRFWSSGCQRLYGWAAQEAIGKSSHELLRTIFPVPLAEIEAVLRQEGEWSGDLRHTRKDGEDIIVAARKVLRRDAAGNPVAVMESVADVTALRLAEDELRRLNGELEQRVQHEVAEREQAQIRLAQAEKLTALGQLAAGIAHDFNNVLQTVSGGASVIARRADQPNLVRKYADMIQDASARGASIASRLLAFGRRDELSPEVVDVMRLLQEMRDILARTLGPHVEVRLDAPKNLPSALVDRRQLETVLINLATNARDAIADHGALTLAAKAETIGPEPGDLKQAPGDYIRFDVTDDGAGMDEATLRRAMEPFFTTKAQGKGAGLGLSMARGFAEQSGGALAIQSARGRGTKVSLWLPAVGGKEDAPALETRQESEATHVLLVDDDDLVRDVLAEGLADLGFKVTQAASGEEALALLAAAPDVLVSDYAMPKMDGLALVRRVQSAAPLLPAILLTGYDGDVYAMLDKASSQVITLLRKPITAAKLAESVAAAASACD